MTLQKIEEYLFERYKHCVNWKMKYKYSAHWCTVEELEKALNELFNYDFPHANGKYYAIKNEKIVYEYVYE